MDLILASASPRRKELLTQAGFTFTIHTADADESPRPGEDAIALATRLAHAKAQAVAAQFPDAAILGADTVVIAPTGELLGKPSDAADAARMLRLLAGATHSVVTGVCLITPERTEVASSLTWVSFLSMSDEEIAAYVATTEPMGKAGAYAIQGLASRWIPHISGDYTNVVGLPLSLVAAILESSGIQIATKLDAAIRKTNS